MNTLRFDVPFDDPPGFKADAVLGETVFAVLVEPKDLRRFRASLLEIAHNAGAHPARRGILVLDGPRITEDRLIGEWQGLRKVFQPEILRRLTMVIHREGTPDRISGELSSEDRESINAVVQHARLHSLKGVRRRPEIFFDILRILINQWIRRAGPLTSGLLAEMAACTYPTIASALETLKKYLIRHSDRRVELKAFPKDEWFRLVANADKVRQTLRFADRSGQPRSIESLLARLQKLRPEGVSVAGVPGARRLDPSLDLVGIPRLDLTVHCRTKNLDTGFLRQLDPGLKPARHDEPSRVVIHTLRQARVFFETDAEGVLWADPVECLLDLHEMRLESQASEFLKFLFPKTT